MKYETINNIKKENEEIKSEKDKDKKRESNRGNKENNNKKEIKKEKDLKSYIVDKNNSNKENKKEKKKIEKKKYFTNVGSKNEILTANANNKKISLINNNEQFKPFNKNFYNNSQVCTLGEKTIDTDYGKYKDGKENNLISYRLKKYIKKRKIKIRILNKKK